MQQVQQVPLLCPETSSAEDANSLGCCGLHQPHNSYRLPTTFRAWRSCGVHHHTPWLPAFAENTGSSYPWCNQQTLQGEADLLQSFQKELLLCHNGAKVVNSPTCPVDPLNLSVISHPRMLESQTLTLYTSPRTSPPDSSSTAVPYLPMFQAAGPTSLQARQCPRLQSWCTLWAPMHHSQFCGCSTRIHPSHTRATTTERGLK